MREIEVKAKVSDPKNLYHKSKKLGISFNDPIVQEDITYETKLSKEHPDWNIFRIRKQGDDLILTMKYKASNRSRDHHERETIIGDANQVVDMLERVGYSLGVTVRKTRRIAKHNNLEICLDEVENLGTFIEIEKLADDDVDVDLIQSELWSLLLELGIKPEDRTHKGYDMLMYDALSK